MRYLTPNAVQLFVPVGTKVEIKVAGSRRDNPDKYASEYETITHMRNAYFDLLEVRNNIVTVSEIIETEGLVSFEVLKGQYYEPLQRAQELQLVWDTTKNAVCLKETVNWWRSILGRDLLIRETFIQDIRKNDLNHPDLLDFGTDLLLYLMNCKFEDGICHATREAISLARMADA